MLGKEYNISTEVNLDGLFIAEVIDNMDPKALERVKVRVLGVHDTSSTDPEYSVWAAHCAASKSASGEIPDIGDFIYVMFLNNDPMHIVWVGWCRVIG